MCLGLVWFRETFSLENENLMNEGPGGSMHSQLCVPHFVIDNIRVRTHTYVCAYTHTQEHTHTHTCRGKGGSWLEVKGERNLFSAPVKDSLGDSSGSRLCCGVCAVWYRLEEGVELPVCLQGRKSFFYSPGVERAGWSGLGKLLRKYQLKGAFWLKRGSRMGWTDDL